MGDRERKRESERERERGRDSYLGGKIDQSREYIECELLGRGHC